jgi:hypothetical protein
MEAAKQQVSRGLRKTSGTGSGSDLRNAHHISANGRPEVSDAEPCISALSSCAGTLSNMSQATWRSAPHLWGAQSVSGMRAQAPARACGRPPPHLPHMLPVPPLLSILHPPRLSHCCAEYLMARQSQVGRHISCAAACGPAAWRQPLATQCPSLLLVRRGRTPLSIRLPHGATGLVPADLFFFVGTTLITRRKPAPEPAVASAVSWALPPAWHPSHTAPALPPVAATWAAPPASAGVRQKRLTTPPILQEPPAKRSRVSTAPRAAPHAEWRLAPPSRHVAAQPGRPAAASTLAAWAAMRGSLGASSTEAPRAAVSQVPGYQAGSPLMTWLGKFAAMLSPGQSIA